MLDTKMIDTSNKFHNIVIYYLDLVNNLILSLTSTTLLLLLNKDEINSHIEFLNSSKQQYLKNLGYWAPEVILYNTKNYAIDIVNYLRKLSLENNSWALSKDTIFIYHRFLEEIKMIG